MAEGIIHVAPNDPRRCQAITAKGQCLIQSVEGSQYCIMHSGSSKNGENREKMIRQYRLAQWQQRVDEFSEHQGVKSLREEIGICRMILETIILQCKDQTDLLLYSAKITDLVGRIEKLVVSCNRLESSMGMLLDKTAALHLASQIVTIIGEHIPDGEVIDAVANDITMAILNIKPEELESA